MAAAQPRRGDLIRVTWVDIFEDSNGDPGDAHLACRKSVGIFWERRKLDCGREVLITTTTVDEEAEAQCGWCCYPMACVDKVQIVKRAPKGKG